MAKKDKPESTNPEETAPVKRQRGKQSYVSRLFPFIGELKMYAEDKYKAARFDENTSDSELEKRNELRKVLADFPIRQEY